MSSRKAVLLLVLSAGLLTSSCSTGDNTEQLQSLLIENPGVGSCTVSAEIIYNNERALITALHCIGEADSVEAPTLSAPLPVMKRFETYDLALLRAPESIRLPQYATSDFPEAGKEACKAGIQVAEDCGLVIGPGQVDGTVVMMIDVCSVPGDSGSAITWNGSLIGVEGGDVSYAPGFDDDLPCNFLEQSLKNPLYSLGLPADLIPSGP